MSVIKICPFCKGRINHQNEVCPLCNMRLIERINSGGQPTHLFTNNENRKQTDIKEKEKRVFEKRKKKLLNNTVLKNYLKYTILSVTILSTSYFLSTILNLSSENSDDVLTKQELTDSRNTEGNNKNTNSNISETEIEEPVNLPPEKVYNQGHLFLKNKSCFRGLGNLTIKNGTGNDAVVKLVSAVTNKSVLTAFIKRHSNFSIKRISNGDYFLYFVLGTHYDEDNQIFLKNCSYSYFSDEFSFRTRKYEIPEGTETEYSVFEVTLHPVEGGTAKTVDVSKNEFVNL